MHPSIYTIFWFIFISFIWILTYRLMSKKEKGNQVFRMNFIGCLSVIPMLLFISRLVYVLHESSDAPSGGFLLLAYVPIYVPIIWAMVLVLYSNFMEKGEVKIKKMISDDLLDD